MAVQLNAGSVTRGKRHGYRPMADINVTPMVDVMLVLLVIFMVTAPLLTAGVPVDLPNASAAPLTQEEQPISVSIKADGTVWLQDTQVQLDELAPKITAIIGAKTDTKIYVRGDTASNYGAVMQVMGALVTGGINHVALVTQPQGGPAPTTGKPAAPAKK